VKINIFFFSIKLALIFSFLFDVNFIALPGLTTARLSLVFLLMYSMLFRFKMSRVCLNALAVVAFVFLVCFLQYLGSRESTQISRIIWFALYGIVTPMLLVQALKDQKEFFLLITIACALQALIAIFSFINPSIKAMLYDLVIFTANFDEKQTLRAVAFSSAGGASLSVVQSFGVISGIFLLKYYSPNFIQSVFLYLSIIIITLSTFIIGRTGLVVSLLAIMVYLLSLKFKPKNIAVLVSIFILVTQIDLTRLTDKLMKDVDGFNIELFTAWIENAFIVKDNATTEELSNMPVPPISFQTIIGTGRVTDVNSGANASGHDSGYIQAYYSMGLILAIFFYLSYAFFLTKLIRFSNFSILYVLLIMVFLLEIKEPFIFQYALPFFILTTVLVISKSSTCSITQYPISKNFK
jgi:hypothetical protein